MEDRDAGVLTLCHARFTGPEFEACARLAGGPRTRLSPLPSPAPAPLSGPEAAPSLTSPWQQAFERLGAAKSCCRVVLGTPTWMERTSFYSSGSWEEGSMVILVPAGRGCRIGFPASPQDVLDLTLNHLGGTVMPGPSGFRDRFPAVEFSVLLAAASLPAPAVWFTPKVLLEACTQSQPTPVPPVRWAAAAPWALEFDEASAASGLAFLRARGLMYSLDNVHYAASQDLAGVLESLRTMERYATVDFLAEMPAGDVRSVRFVAFVSRHSWWLVDYGGDARQDAGAWVESILPQQLELAFGRLAGLTQISPKEETVNGEPKVSENGARNYELTEEEISQLVRAAGCAPVPGSPISALRPRSAALEQEAAGKLAQRGLLAANRAEPGLGQALAALARPDFEIVEVGGVLPRLAVSRSYASVRPETSFVVAYNSSGPDRHLLRFPLRAEEVFPVTHALLRTGRAGGIAPFKAVLDRDEYAVLVTLVDVYRGTALAAMMNRQAGFSVTVTPARIAEVFHQGTQSTDRRWLVTLVRELSLVPCELAYERIPAALARLAQRGYLIVSAQHATEGAYQIAPDCAAFCHSLSIAEAAVGVALAAGRSTGTLEPIGFMAFWAAGMLWMMEYTADHTGAQQVNLQTVLPAELSLGLRAAYKLACDRARELLRISSLASQPPAAGTRAGSAQPSCPGCGAVLAATANFCPKCGTRLQAKPPAQTQSFARMCQNCGRAVQPDLKFCTACGARVN